MTDYYSYGVFRYTQPQMMWLMYHSGDFTLGVWPQEPAEYETDEQVTVYDKDGVPVYKMVKVLDEDGEEIDRIAVILKEWKRVNKISSYIDPLIRSKQRSKQSPFANASGIHGDLLDRLKTAGKVGVCLFDAALKGQEMEDLADPEKDVLKYISDWKQKKQNYPQWLSSRVYRLKRNKPIHNG